MTQRIMSHIGQYLWPWTIGMAVLGALAIFGREQLGTGYHLGDLAALALGDDWDVLIAEVRTRPATGPDGQESTLDDSVVLVRRR